MGKSRTVGVSGMPLRIKGTATLQLELSNHQYQIEVIVAELRTGAILGINFLNSNQCATDLPQGTMSLNENSKLITLGRTRSQTDPVDNLSVVLSSNVCIPGSSEMEVSAVIQGPIRPGIMMVE